MDDPILYFALAGFAVIFASAFYEWLYAPDRPTIFSLEARSPKTRVGRLLNYGGFLYLVCLFGWLIATGT